MVREMILLTAGETYDRMFGLDWQLLADASLTLVAVFVLFFIMSYFLFNPARRMLQNRKLKIQNELEEARTSLEKAEAMKADYEGRIRNIEKEAEDILSQARKKALANEAQIIAEAHTEAGRILEKARMEAALEKQKMADDVKKEMIEIASLMAGKVVSASIDTTVQDQLFEETLKEMGENTWLS